MESAIMAAPEESHRDSKMGIVHPLGSISKLQNFHGNPLKSKYLWQSSQTNNGQPNCAQNF